MAEHHHGESEAGEQVLRGLRLAVELSVVIFLIEAAGAYLSHSLSLSADAVHDLPDILAFAVSWTALNGTQRGSTESFTFGTHRLEVFAGLLNGGLVLGTGVLFAVEAFQSLHTGAYSGRPVDALWLLAAAVPTIALRAANLAVLGRIPSRVRDLNLASVMVHLASDIAITVTLLSVGGVLLLAPSASWVDPAAAFLVGGILIYESLPLLREGAHVLTERTPRGLSVGEIRKEALTVPGVAELHDVHVWAVCSSLVCMTAHVGVGPMTLEDGMGVIRRLRDRMQERFGIVHATFELESPPGAA
ncbi:MAG: cation diffusion facilitator family transporter [Thermoplasmata archaeon]|nr:cation diffusion facilitator family transporter [Thermoplasmata archaeon]